MSTAPRPKLRDRLAAERADGSVNLYDPYRVGQPVQLSPLALEVVKRLDGTRTLRDVQAELTTLTGGTVLPLDTLEGLVTALDSALLLDSPAFAERISGPVRKPTCIGAYEGDPTKLREQVDALFTAPGGPGLPGAPTPSPHGRLRAVLVPHMDYARGNVTYGWGFKELAERTDARLFVIVATSHYSPHRYTLSRQHFETPLGVYETDMAFVDRIAAEYGPGLFDDPLAHVPEHSIELEVVILQHVFAGRGPIRIVPLLCGSLADCVDEGTDPAGAKDVARMTAALRTAEATAGEPVCYVVSGDLAHIGPKFGDRRKAEGPWLGESETQDRALLAALEAADPVRYFGVIAAEGDARRICGLPPTYLTLAAARPTAGRVLHYQQFVHPKGHESVSFAAAAFYGCRQ
ncbi:MAG TPA: AmmeMemoRadiSam system protein B [Urbifossiella sp.]|nr:AmmeMemoRadiSam system protein B [Urbifossiella sp.]